MQYMQNRSKLIQRDGAREIHVINSFISSYVQQYETQGATSELLQSLSFFLNIKF